MLTTNDVLKAFSMLQAGGLKPMDYIQTAADPAVALLEAAGVWAAALGDITAAQLGDAVIAYLRRPKADGQWVKPWPTVDEVLDLARELGGGSERSMRALAQTLFAPVVTARASTSRDDTDAGFRWRVRFYADRAGIALSDEQLDATCRALGNWRTWDPGDPTRGGNAAAFTACRNRFVADFAAYAGPAAHRGEAITQRPELRAIPSAWRS